jgi:hypothetical protein
MARCVTWRGAARPDPDGRGKAWRGLVGLGEAGLGEVLNMARSAEA